MSKQSTSTNPEYAGSGVWDILRVEFESLQHQSELAVQSKNDVLFKAVKAHFSTHSKEWIDPFCGLIGADRSGAHHKRRVMSQQYKLARQFQLSDHEMDNLRRRIHRLTGVRSAVQADKVALTSSLEDLQQARDAAHHLGRLYPSARELDRAIRDSVFSTLFDSRRRALYRAVRGLNRQLRACPFKLGTLDLSLKDARHYRDILSGFEVQESRITVLRHSIKHHERELQRLQKQLSSQEGAARFIEAFDPSNLDKQLFRMIMNRCWRKPNLLSTLTTHIPECPDMEHYLTAQSRKAALDVISAFFPEGSEAAALPSIARDEQAQTLVREALACIPDHEFVGEGHEFPEVSFFAELMASKPQDSRYWLSLLWLADQFASSIPKDTWMMALSRSVTRARPQDPAIKDQLQEAQALFFQQAS